MARRRLSIWFPRLASDTSLRSCPVEGVFALILRSDNADHLHCLYPAASGAAGERRSKAGAICSQHSPGAWEAPLHRSQSFETALNDTTTLVPLGARELFPDAATAFPAIIR